MPDDPYTLGDLARLADVTPRTVRYYVAQGLLPSPEAAGPATRYGEGHLARLRLIRRLQREHLPLAEIRLRLERMGDDEVVATVRSLAADEPGPGRSAGGTLAYVQSLMAGSGIASSVADHGSGGAEVARMDVATSLEAAWADRDASPPEAQGDAVPAAPAPMPSLSLPMQAGPAATGPRGLEARRGIQPDEPRPVPVTDRSTWERVAISPDVELHVRRPLDRSANRRVDQLLRIARELFEPD